MANNSKKKNIKIILLIAAAVLIFVDGIILFFKFYGGKDKIKASEITDAKNFTDTVFAADSGFFTKNPSDTVRAIDELSEYSVDAVLLNTWKTKDGKIVTASTDELDRLTGADGKIGDKTYFEILEKTVKFDYKDEKTAHARVPLLSEMMEKCQTAGLKVIVNIRNKSDASRIMDSIGNNPAYAQTFYIMCDDYETLYRLQQKKSENVFLYKVDKVTDETLKEMQYLKNTRLCFNARNSANRDKLLEKLKEKGLSFSCYNVNSESEILRYAPFGVKEIISSKIVK